jgi:hypothetical protein
MPLMCGPGAIATILGMTSKIKRASSELARHLQPLWQPHDACDLLVSRLRG